MRSLRARLLLAVSFATLALALTYLWIVPGVVYVTEDVVFERVVAQALRHNAEALAARGTLDPAPDWLQVWVGLEDLDPTLRAQVDSLGMGIHEVNDLPGPDGAVRELFVGVESIERDGAETPLVVVADVTPFEAYERIPAPFFVGVIALGLAVAALLAAFGLMLSFRLFGALGRLQALVSLDGDGFFRARRGDFGDDEVGRLAKRLADSSDRLAVAMQRERDFTRDASHELRTPLTVARGAVELLEQQLERGDAPDEARLAQLLQRLRVAHGDMEGIVRVFLWLARESVDPEDLPTVDVAETLAEARRDAEAVARSQHATLDLQVDVRGASPVQAPPEVVAAVVRNLLQNAVRHAGGRPVSVVLGDGVLDCRNPVDAEDGGRAGFGFGLGIVGRLCERFGWGIEVGVRGGEFRARISFRRS